MQMLYGLGAVSFHVVVVGGTGAVHLMDGFVNMLVNFIQIVPVADVRECGASHEGQAECGDYKRFLHGCSSGSRFYPISPGSVHIFQLARPAAGTASPIEGQDNWRVPAGTGGLLPLFLSLRLLDSALNVVSEILDVFRIGQTRESSLRAFQQGIPLLRLVEIISGVELREAE
jgi:hypothetical protein